MPIELAEVKVEGEQTYEVILRFLHENDEQAWTISELAEKLPLTRAAINGEIYVLWRGNVLGRTKAATDRGLRCFYYWDCDLPLDVVLELRNPYEYDCEEGERLVEAVREAKNT